MRSAGPILTEHYDSESGLSLDMAQIPTKTAVEFDGPVPLLCERALDAYWSQQTETTTTRLDGLGGRLRRLSRLGLGDR